METLKILETIKLIRYLTLFSTVVSIALLYVLNLSIKEDEKKEQESQENY